MRSNMPRGNLVFFVGLVLITLSLVFSTYSVVKVMSAPLATSASVPATVSFEGYLASADGRSPIGDGAYSMTFKIYNVSSGGSALWSSGPISVAVTHGLYTLQLAVPAAASSLWSNSDLYIGVTNAPHEEMTPRIQIGSVPFALNAEHANSAENADMLDNLHVADIVALGRAINGRLTLTSGIPVPTTDITAATIVYFTPYAGNVALVYAGSQWAARTFSEISATVPATAYRLFDIFAYDNGGTLALETANWNQTSGAVAGATNASPIVVTSNSHGLAVNDVIAIAGVLGNTGANGVWQVSAVTANSFTLHGSVGNGAYTSGGAWYKMNNLSRAAPLALQDGVYVKSGDPSRRYLGTGTTGNVAGQTEDSLLRRYLWNYYNRVQKPLLLRDFATHSFNSTTARYWNNSPATSRLYFVAGMLEQYVKYDISAQITAGTNGTYANVWTLLNRSINPFGAPTYGTGKDVAMSQGFSSPETEHSVGPAGMLALDSYYNFLPTMEHTGNNTTFNSLVLFVDFDG